MKPLLPAVSPALPLAVQAAEPVKPDIQADRPGPVIARQVHDHAFAMHLPFIDATALPVQLSGVPTYTPGAYSIPAASASAARSVDGRLMPSLANTHPNEAPPLQLAVGAKGVRAASGQRLTAAPMDAENRLDAPDRVRPRPFQAEASNGLLALTLPAKSVLVLELQP